MNTTNRPSSARGVVPVVAAIVLAAGWLACATPSAVRLADGNEGSEFRRGDSFAENAGAENAGGPEFRRGDIVADASGGPEHRMGDATA